jgi:hypothetical protein
MTLLPGLIDAHVHILSPGMLRQSAAFGVTTELDMFMAHQLADELRKQPDFTRADFRTAGTLVTAPGGHGTQFGLSIPTLAEPANAQSFIDARIAEGSDYIKLVYDDGRALGIHFQTLSKPTLEAAIAAAHQRKKLAVVHVTDQQAAREAVNAGADGLAHIFCDSPADDAFIKSANARGIFIISTLSVIEGLSGPGGKLADDPLLQPMLTPADKSNLKSSFPMLLAKKQRLENAMQSVRALHAAGIAILAGTDAPNPATAHGASIHRELELLTESGLSPAEALAAETSAPAAKFALADRGRIAKGLRADLLLVKGDPTADIKATRDIQRVWIAGREFDRDSYRKSVDAARIAADTIRQPGLLKISDFEDGAPSSSFGLGWSVSTDQLRQGKSTAEIKIADGGADGSKRSLRVSGTINPAFAFPWAGAMFFPGSGPMQPCDLSAKKTISFWAKGDGKDVQVMLFARALGMRPAVAGFTAGPQWQRLSFAIADFGCDGKDITALLISGGPNAGAFEFQIDQVVLE